eukprot:scaffold3685_cov132-Skeletonema_dohrnii-CCMP3373.AAC.1
MGAGRGKWELDNLAPYSLARCVTKEDFAVALRAHQAAVDATKSPQREEGEDFLRRSLDE